MIPLSACLTNLAPKVVKVGAGPERTMLVPSAILFTSLGFLRNKAPSRLSSPTFYYCSLTTHHDEMINVYVFSLS